jgi:hypothetical protein
VGKKVRRLFYAAAITPALVSAASSADNPLISDELATATSFFNDAGEHGDLRKDTGEGSRTDYAAHVLDKMNFEHVRNEGRVTHGTSPVVQGRAYTVIIRCETEVKIGILFFVAGNYPKEASFILRSVQAVWQGRPLPSCDASLRCGE